MSILGKFVWAREVQGQRISVTVFSPQVTALFASRFDNHVERDYAPSGNDHEKLAHQPLASVTSLLILKTDNRSLLLSVAFLQPTCDVFV